MHSYAKDDDGPGFMIGVYAYDKKQEGFVTEPVKTVATESEAQRWVNYLNGGTGQPFPAVQEAKTEESILPFWDEYCNYRNAVWNDGMACTEYAAWLKERDAESATTEPVVEETPAEPAHDGDWLDGFGWLFDSVSNAWVDPKNDRIYYSLGMAISIQEMRDAEAQPTKPPISDDLAARWAAHMKEIEKAALEVALRNACADFSRKQWEDSKDDLCDIASNGMFNMEEINALLSR